MNNDIRSQGLMRDTGKEMQLIRLPDEMQDWAEANKPMISRLATAIAQKPGITEGAIWDIIASESSPEWMHARSTLNSAEQQMRYVMLPENMPLGLIGKALHSEETNSAQRALQHAQAGFTIIDESLRQEATLQKLMNALKAHQHIISQSLDLSRNAASMTAAFATVAGFDTPETTETPQRKSGFNLQNGTLSYSFRETRKLMHRTSAALKSKGAVFRAKPAESV